jgi:hypothetical protein
MLTCSVHHKSAVRDTAAGKQEFLMTINRLWRYVNNAQIGELKCLDTNY